MTIINSGIYLLCGIGGVHKSGIFTGGRLLAKLELDIFKLVEAGFRGCFVVKAIETEDEVL